MPCRSITVHSVNVLPDIDARVIHKNIDMPETRERGICEALDLRRIGQIAGDIKALRTVPAQQRSGVVCPGSAAADGKHRAVPGKQPGNGEPEPMRAGGDQAGLPGQKPVHIGFHTEPLLRKQ